MRVKVIALEQFVGATNEHGTLSQVYEKGKTYEVPENALQDFIEGGLVALDVENVEEPTGESTWEEKPTRGKGKAAKAEKGSVSQSSWE